MAEQYNIETDSVETVEMVEISAKELAELRKKLTQVEDMYKYYSKLSDEKETELRRIYEILDNLPLQYSVVTRLAIWLGNR